MVSQDVIVHDKPSDKQDGATPAGALSETSEPAGQEFIYSARVSLNEAQMQVEDKMVARARHGGDGRNQDGHATDDRIRDVPAVALSSRKLAGAVGIPRCGPTHLGRVDY
jgi:hypothetical protein